jgi:hypothetical protein
VPEFCFVALRKVTRLNRVAKLSSDNVVNEISFVLTCEIFSVHTFHANERSSIRSLRRRRRGYTLRALSRRVFQVFLPRYHSRTPRTPTAVQPILFPAQISPSTPLILVMLHCLTDTHLLFHFRLKLAAYPHNLLRHVTTPAVFVTWRLGALSYQLVGAAFVFSIHVLRCEACVAPTAFYPFVSFA